MKRFAFAMLALGLGLGAANAQNAAPAPEPAPAGSAAPVAPAAKQTGKEVRAQCKADAKSQGLKGDARKAAVDDCFAKARPDLAEARKCRQDGKAKGLADAELKAFVKQCKVAAQ
jgi:psiF repeat